MKQEHNYLMRACMSTLFDHYLDKHSETITGYAHSKGILAHKISAFSQEELYFFLDSALEHNVLLPQVEKAFFQEFVLDILGDDLQVRAFLYIRDYIRDVLVEAEAALPLPIYDLEARRQAQLQALAGWHHVH